MTKPSDTATPLWVLIVVGVGCLVLGAGAGYLFAPRGTGGAEAGAAPGGGPGGPPPAQVRVGTVEVKELQNRVPVIGRLQEVRRVTVTAEVEGRVVGVAVDQGSKVTGGETTLANVDRTLMDLAEQSADAAVAEAQANLKQSRTDLEQLTKLREANSAMAKEVEDQRTAVAGNEARLAAAVAAQERARTEAQRTTVVAPFDGAVTQKLAEVGQWVTPGDPVVEMISTGEIDAVIDLPERYVAGLSMGDEIGVRVEVLKADLTGRVVAIRPDAMTASRTFPVKVRIDDPGDQLRPGMSVVAHVPVSEMKMFATVPRDAVLQTAGGAVVWYAMDPSAMGGPSADSAPGGPPPGGAGEPASDGGDGNTPQAGGAGVASAPGSGSAGGGASGAGGAAASGAGPMAMSEPVNVLFGVGGDRYAVEPLPGAQGPPALTEGTPVVIEGAERLFPTQPLILLNDTPADAAAQARSAE